VLQFEIVKGEALLQVEAERQAEAVLQGEAEKQAEAALQVEAERIMLLFLAEEVLNVDTERKFEAVLQVKTETYRGSIASRGRMTSKGNHASLDEAVLKVDAEIFAS
jgi:hypothetical protein